jgi:hypothetical protein
MKQIKILLALIMLLVVCQANAQITRSRTLEPTRYYYLDASDYSLAVTGDSVLTYTITLNKGQSILYDVQATLDSVGGTPDYLVDLQGLVFPGDTPTDLETDVNWTGTTSDTTILFTEHTTPVFVRQLIFKINGQAGTGAATLDKLEIQIWK